MTKDQLLDVATLQTAWDAFRIMAARHPEHDCICVPALEGRHYAAQGLTWSYAEAARRASELREVYARAGYGHGHRVAIMFDNRPSFVVHWLALNALGISLVPINQESTSAEIGTLLKRSYAALVLGLPHRLPLLRDAVVRMDEPIPIVSAEWPATLPAAKTPHLGTSPGPLTETGLLFTSGTTGVSKGARLTNESVLFNGDRYVRAGGLMQIAYGGERLYNPLPLTYANAFAHSNIAMILTAGCMIFPDRFHPSGWWPDIVETRATIIHHLGIIVPLLLQADATPEEREHRVKFGLGGGVSASQHTAWQARFGFPLIEVYGMTELGICSFANSEPRLVGGSYVGQPTQDVEFRIADENDAEAPPGVAGEVLVRRTGPNPRRGFFAGYLDNDELTEHLWRNGWYHTGDILSRDEAGRYFFVDRLKHMIRRSGQNISAGEVENCLREHPAVAEVACVPAPDTLRQEEVVACIILKPSAEPTRDSALSIVEWTLKRIAYFKVPGGVVFVTELPTTSSKKLQKFRIFADGEDVFSRSDCFDVRSLKQRRSQPT